MVDSGASMRMLSRKDLESAEKDTIRVPRTPAMVVTANGEVPTNEEATVYVYDLDLFVTVQLLEDTPTVLSLGKLSEYHGYSCEWSTGQKPHRCSRMINRTSQLDNENVNIGNARLNDESGRSSY